MSDKIKVGDRVRISVYDGFHDATVLALDADWAWVLQDHDRRGYTSVSLAKLTLISPEPVTLRAKYGVGQRVRSTLTGLTYTIKGPIRATYRMTNGFVVDESNLEPVPTPCPTCKGSGKSE